MFRAFNLSSKYGRSKAEKILLTYQTFAISVKVPTPYTTQPPCHNCVAILGEYGLGHFKPLPSHIIDSPILLIRTSIFCPIWFILTTSLVKMNGHPAQRCGSAFSGILSKCLELLQ